MTDRLTDERSRNVTCVYALAHTHSLTADLEPGRAEADIPNMMGM